MRCLWFWGDFGQPVSWSSGLRSFVAGELAWWNCNTLATWCEELTPWKKPSCWERLKAGGEGDDREWDGWMASPIWWTWVWASFGSWWWTGRPGVLQSMESQRVGHNWTTELNWIEPCIKQHLRHQSSPCHYGAASSSLATKRIFLHRVSHPLSSNSPSLSLDLYSDPRIFYNASPSST